MKNKRFKWGLIMINILLDVLNFSADFLYEELKRYIHPSDKVVILAFSYRDGEVQNLRDWKILCGKSGGRYYDSMVSRFFAMEFLKII
ncbi:hypothetical protein B5G28_13145 [Faecalibacterium sp. An77]|nr:hypothetical protein B5G28_13145 [Faecalibacterium sp. An77]